MEQFTLSICIPTYNRERYLKRLIDSIISQEGFSDKIEIVINDGPSKDNTTWLVKAYQKLYRNIRYYQNNQAIGMTAAIMESVEYSNGKYTRIFSSDDVMDPYALEHAISLIETKSPTLIINNRFEFLKTNDYSHIYNETLHYDIFNWFKEFWNYLWNNIDKTLNEKTNYFTFVSIACFETKHYHKSLQNILNILPLSELKQNYFNWAILIYSSLKPNNKIALIRNKLVYAQTNNSGRNANNKIINDLKKLFSILSEEYHPTKICQRFFEKTINIRKNYIYMTMLLNPIRNSRFLKRFKNNKVTKSLYLFGCKTINFIFNKIS